MKLFIAIFAIVVLTASAVSAEPVPVARWALNQSGPDSTLQTHGNLKWAQPGPRSPEFPAFSAENLAVAFDGKGASLQVHDSGNNPDFQFQNGDRLTIETWVKLNSLPKTGQVYLVGKGRTGAGINQEANQNWSLRLGSQESVACLDFLFTTRVPGAAPKWHRWRSHAGFVPTTGWHLVTLSYEFGKPESMRGWIDGQPTEGTWELTGPTTDPPVVDHDSVWIGTSMKRSPGVSLDGLLHGLSIYRECFTDAQMAGRFERQGGPQVVQPAPERMPELAGVPTGQVQFTLAEGFPRHDGWLMLGEQSPETILTWTGNEFLLPRIPHRYDDWGIRSFWKSSVLLRMAADVEFEPGEYQLLLRARGLSRLWIDGKLVTTTTADKTRYDGGRNPVHPPGKAPLPGHRPLPGNMQEVTVNFSVPPAVTNSVAQQGNTGTESTNSDTPRTHRVVLEVIVGGRGVRPEAGEICVARLKSGSSTYEILRPAGQAPLHLTATEAAEAVERIKQELVTLDHQTRRQAAASENEFWNKRHTQAREWTQLHPAPEIPQPDVGQVNELHPIDAFLEAKIAAARAQSAQSTPAPDDHFQTKVLPILRAHCYRCHADKDQGGLRLDTRERALLGGDSSLPAIVPGDPHASELVERIRTNDEGLRMPPAGPLPEQDRQILEKWIADGAVWPLPPVAADLLTLPDPIDDAAFARRVYLDTLGVPPSPAELQAFVNDPASSKREQLIERLLASEQTADHWISFWQDLLAENPSLISATLNSTGPFRWFLYESLQDKKPLDRFVTELIMMRGSVHEGGSAGFSVAGENDSPMAAKGHILASAFLGIELQCARCHDSPYHSTKQADLYSLGAMLNRGAIKVPASSSVPAAFFEQQLRQSLIEVTLKPNQPVPPVWPFAEATGVADGPEIDPLMYNPKDKRERLAALITAPQNRRFAQVMVNHFWLRLMGAGLVEPVHDWEGQRASHPELLDWLASELMSYDYDINHVLRLIMTSAVYQRQATGRNAGMPPELRFFNAPERRRMSAEQVVDSLHAVTGKPFDVEILSFDPEGRTTMQYRLSLGRPQRAWMMADLKNERDRPSLSLPKARVILDVLEVFGWTGARQKPITQREVDPNVLQPGILANSVLTHQLSRTTIHSELAELALQAESPEALVTTLFQRVLSREPQLEEREEFVAVLSPHFKERKLADEQIHWPEPPPELPLITWFNHAQSEANTIQMENEQRVRVGPPADPRLQQDWRERYEDVVWSLINHREFVWIP